jgi:four helix bundle protein
METEKRYLKLNDIECYKTAFHLSNKVWNAVMNWDRLAQNTIGEQIIRSTDSISANIAEGFGRYGKKDKIKFYRIAYSSMLESLDWNEKAKARKLTSNEEYTYIFDELQKLPKAINSLIKFTNEKLKN